MEKTFRSGPKRPYGETRDAVLAAFDRNPELNSVQLGAKLGLHPAYIRKALKRAGRTRPHKIVIGLREAIEHGRSLRK